MAGTAFAARGISQNLMRIRGALCLQVTDGATCPSGAGNDLRPNWISGVTYMLPARQRGQKEGHPKVAYLVDLII